MSHEIATKKNGEAAFCFTGERAAIWHGLGQQIEAAAPLEQWAAASGMDFHVQRAFVRFATEAGGPINGRMDDRVVLFRGDTQAPLSVVGEGFKVVQPAEVLEFFRDLLGAAGFEMDTAGVLFGGRKFFASAKINGKLDVGGGDTMEGHLIAATAVDGTMKTTFKNVATRTVCNNTLTMAMSEKGRRMVTTSHRSKVNFETVKAQLGLQVKAAQSEFTRLIQQAAKLSQVSIGTDRAQGFVCSLLSNASTDPTVQEKVRESIGYRKIMALFGGEGMGADMASAKGTAWGLLNAVTEYADHHVRARSDAHRMDSSLFGPGDELKAAAFDQLLAMKS